MQRTAVLPSSSRTAGALVSTEPLNPADRATTSANVQSAAAERFIVKEWEAYKVAGKNVAGAYAEFRNQNPISNMSSTHIDSIIRLGEQLTSLNGLMKRMIDVATARVTASFTSLSENVVTVKGLANGFKQTISEELTDPKFAVLKANGESYYLATQDVIKASGL